MASKLNYTDEFVSWLPDQEFVVEDILQQNNNLFLVKWLDWEAKYNTQEKRSNVEAWHGFHNFECERAERLGLPKPTRGVRGGIKKCQRTQNKNVIIFFL